jgi:hypothetical protein
MQKPDNKTRISEPRWLRYHIKAATPSMVSPTATIPVNIHSTRSKRTMAGPALWISGEN